MKIKILPIVFLSLLLTGTALAMPGIRHFDNFKRIPVLDNGRLKPLDTFARSLLTQLSGHDHYGKQEAASWLASLLFNPQATHNDKIFLINNPDIATALGIDQEKDRRYTPSQLQGSYQRLEGLAQAAKKISDNQRSLVENEIIRVFDGLNIYTDLARSFVPSRQMELSQDQSRNLAMSWEGIAKSYARGDEAGFNAQVRSYLTDVRGVLSKADIKKIDVFPWELFYQSTSPFTWAIMFYIFAFIFFVVSFASSKAVWYRLGLFSVIAGFIPHTLGLALRVIIMARPPVASLYETFVFVGFIAVFMGLVIEYYNRQWLGIITAALCGIAMLFIANKFSAEGDTLQVLVAVLNSNFWLATHVTTITMGYAAACVGGLLGHIWLIQAVFKRDAQVLDKTYKTTLGILGVALTLTFLGTNLGGIWADQSWGRFWGWDPKENGALMIVLWTTLLLHAKTALMIGPLGLSVGAVIGMMVVMWAWFGVNLLSVGLHSYGFTSGVAASLIIYAAFEIVFIIVTAWFIAKK